MKKFLDNKVALAIIFTSIGLCIGWLFFHSNSDVLIIEEYQNTEAMVNDVWTCSMHPQIRQHEQGDCPICGMELIPVIVKSAGPNVIEMSEDAIKLANIQTTSVQFTLPEKEIYMQGKVKVDERRVSNQTSHVSGRIEKLYVSFTGEKIVAGQKLASVYSPELVTAQKELFEAVKTKESSPMLYNASRNKLKQWKLTNAQIDEIENEGKVRELIDIRADKSGVVLERKVAVGDHVTEGNVLFSVADLSRLWIEFDAYEADISWLKLGDEIAFTINSLPGEKYNERISFIDPIVNVQTRTVSIRLEMNNKNGRLKPEMFVNGVVTAKLPIHEAQLTVPKSAVMWTGKRSVVYVAVSSSDRPMFEFRTITLGHDLGGYFIVEDGLKEGEIVVTNGAFKVDAAAQLAGKKSMMNQSGTQVMIGHNHGAMIESEKSNTTNTDLDEAEFMVSGNCDMCKSRIEKAANSVTGVAHADWNKDTKMMTIHFDGESTSKEAVAQAISDVGHDTELQKSLVDIYKELPGCCQYTRDED